MDRERAEHLIAEALAGERPVDDPEVGAACRAFPDLDELLVHQIEVTGELDELGATWRADLAGDDADAPPFDEVHAVVAAHARERTATPAPTVPRGPRPWTLALGAVAAAALLVFAFLIAGPGGDGPPGDPRQPYYLGTDGAPAWPAQRTVERGMPSTWDFSGLSLRSGESLELRFVADPDDLFARPYAIRRFDAPTRWTAPADFFADFEGEEMTLRVLAGVRNDMRELGTQRLSLQR